MKGHPCSSNAVIVGVSNENDVTALALSLHIAIAVHSMDARSSASPCTAVGFPYSGGRSGPPRRKHALKAAL